MRDALYSNTWLPLFARLAVGALLLVAGAWKWRRAEWLAETLAGLGIEQRGVARGLGRLVPTLECLLGSLLICGLGIQIVGPGAALLLASFAGVVLRAVAQRRRARLRCGPGLECRADGWTALRNLALSGLAVLPALLGADPLAADHWLRGRFAAPLTTEALVPAVTFALFLLAVGALLPPLAELAGRSRRLREV